MSNSSDDSSSSESDLDPADALPPFGAVSRSRLATPMPIRFRRSASCIPLLPPIMYSAPTSTTRPGLEPPCVAATRFACARAFCALDGFFGWTPQRLMSTSGDMLTRVARSNIAQLYSRPKMVRRKAIDDGLAFPGTLSGTRARSTVRTRRPRAAACMRVATPRAHPRIARAAESLHVPSGAGQQ